MATHYQARDFETIYQELRTRRAEWRKARDEKRQAQVEADALANNISLRLAALRAEYALRQHERQGETENSNR